ncbi:outer membrane protein assembly factor BamA [Bradymonas sediminis]|nr:outer membrane protein assembly factor BamA [Bradymonas sediminis]
MYSSRLKRGFLPYRAGLFIALFFAAFIVLGLSGEVRAQSADDSASGAAPAAAPSTRRQMLNTSARKMADEIVSSALSDAGEAEERALADAALAGQRIYRIDLVCDLELCQNPVSVAKLRELSGLYIGMEFSRRALRRAERRLGQTGFFEEMDVSSELDAQGVALEIKARGAVLIRRVEFKGVDGAPFESDLRKLLIYRQAQPYRQDATKAATQLWTLINEFEKFGFFGTKINISVREVLGNKHLVDVVFRIKKGEELEICEMGFRGLRSLNYEAAQEKLLAGHSVLVRRFGITAPKFTTDRFKEGLDALIQHYRELGFFQARIVGRVAKKDPARGCVDMLVDVSEGPQWKVEFRGDVEFPIDDLRAELPFFESGFVDPEEIRRAERAIRQLFETRGYPFAQVRGVEERRDRLDRELIFDIDAGPRLTIEDIVLHGNRHFKSEVLLAEFGTRTFGLFTEGGYLQGEQLLDDLNRLEQYYHERGYLQARATRFELQLLPGKGAMRIHIYIDENPRARVRQVRFRGNRTLTEGILNAEVKVHSGGAVRPLQIRADRSRLVQLYASYGYPLAEVETTCHTLSGEQVPCDAPRLPAGCVAASMEDLDKLCQWSSGAEATRVCPRIRDEEQCVPGGGIRQGEVRVVHTIEEGPFVRVGELLLKGNFNTNTGLIYQELPLRTGDVFDVRELLKGQGNMRSLGIFDSVSVEAIGLDRQAREQDNATAALLISVEESRNRYLDFKFGFEGRDLLSDARRLLVTGETQYNDDNLFGRAQRFRPRVIGAFDSLQLFQAGTESAGLASADPVKALDYLVGAELIYEHPRFLKGWTGVDKLALTISPFYMLDLVGVSEENILREEWGLRLGLRKELRELLERLYVSFGIEGKQAALWTPADPTVDGRRIFSPRRVTGKLIPEVTLDRRDSPLNPSQGYYVQAQPALVSGATLAQGGESAISDAYLRLLMRVSYYLPLTDDLVLGQGIGYGHIIPLFERDRLVTEDERFHLGGGGSVRGFGNDALGPLRNEVPSGGEFMINYNAELRYPLIRQLNVYGAVFFDAGLLVDCFSSTENSATRIGCYEDAFGGEHPFAKVRSAAGLGVRYLIVDQIPLVFDYGMVLDRRPGESFGTLNFNLGYSF